MFKKELRYFLLALGFFTRIPMPSYVDFEEAELNHSVKYFPLIGIIVGLVGAAFFYLASLIFPQSLAVLVSMASTIYLTGAFHEDGLADSADGIGGGWQREQILTIMQDSRLGTYGTLALFFALITKYQLLVAMNVDMVLLGLICGHVLSRLSAVWLMRALPYVKFSGKSKPLATSISTRDLWVANSFGLLPFLLFVWLMFVATFGNWMTVVLYVLLVFLAVGTAWWWWHRMLKRKLGGYTGDTLGAMQQMAEIAFYFACLVWLQIMIKGSV